MINSNSGRRIIAIAISILLHGAVLFFVLKETTMSADLIMDEQQTITQIRIDFTPEPQPESEPEPEPEQKPKPKKQREIKSGSKNKRDNYSSYVARRITSKKHYPKAAERRSIKGSVKVSFTILCSGSVANLRAGSGHKILKKAALATVKKAQPFRKPPNCPREINYRMKYGSD